MSSSARGVSSFLCFSVLVGMALIASSSNVTAQDDVCLQKTINFETKGEVKQPISIIRVNRKRGKSARRLLSGDSGPVYDHTYQNNSGYYLVFPGLFCNNTFGGMVELDTEEAYNPPKGSTCSLEFWYSMEGNNTGCLDVYVREEINSSLIEAKLLWERCGNQFTGKSWKKAEITNVTTSPGFRTTLRFILKCRLGVPQGEHGDVAIDDIKFTCHCPVTTSPTTQQTTTASPILSATPNRTSNQSTVTMPLTMTSMPSESMTSTMKSPSSTASSAPRTEPALTKTSSNKKTPSPATASQTITITTTASQSFAEKRGGGGSGIPIAIIAGGAAGIALLFIVIIILAYKRRRNSTTSGSKRLGNDAKKFDNPNYSGGCYPYHLRQSPTSESTTETQQTTTDQPIEGGERKVVAMTRKNPYYEHKYCGSQRKPDAMPKVALEPGDASEYDDTLARTYDEPGADRMVLSDQEPEALGIEYEECYDDNCHHDNAPRYTVPGEVTTSPSGVVKTGYDHLQHDEIAEEVYSQPYCEPGTTPKALYQQLAGQAYRHLARAHVQLKEELGSGSFGIVYSGIWKRANGTYLKTAVKLTKVNASADVRLKLLQEAAIMGQFRHKNVVQLYGVVTDDESAADEMDVWLVLELMSKDLKTHLVELRTKWTKKSSNKELFPMCRDIAEGMAYLAMRGFVHRDLAARNVMLDSSGTCKIGDFGMSRDLEENDFYKSAGGVIPVKWSAPEAIHYRQFSQASDVWSYGVVLYEIFTLGRKPYAGWYNEDVARQVCTGYRLEQPEACPDRLYSLMKACWLQEKEDRPTFSAILEHLIEIMPNDGHQREVDIVTMKETCGGRLRRMRGGPKRRSVVSEI